MVGQVLAANAADPTVNTLLALEQQINALVAALYGLTTDEEALLVK